MLDFLMISERNRKSFIEIYPKFIINRKSSDLMIRGGDFYAIWDSETHLWSTDEQDAIRLIDKEIDEYVTNKYGSTNNEFVRVLHMWDAESGIIDAWHKYCQKQMRDNFHALDEDLTFSNTELKKRSYASHVLAYPLVDGECPAYDKLMSVLYSPEERMKIEWAIGSIINGDSKKIQKFIVLYGSAGTGKSTVLNIIQQLFDGYYSTFDSKALGSSSSAFALESFRTNPLVAIQHDGDLSRIEDNTRLNSLVSHELMTVNEKFKSQYQSKFKCFLFMGTNKPVKITDTRSGLIRRLIDVHPTGNKVTPKEYKELTSQIPFELGAIASHCKEVYENNIDAYDDYIPTDMMTASNDFFNFAMDNYYDFKTQEIITLKQAWALYSAYCETAKVLNKMPQRAFREEMKNYFFEYIDRGLDEDGNRTRSLYKGFKLKLDGSFIKKSEISLENHIKEEPKEVINGFLYDKSSLDDMLADCPAQYANEEGTPVMPWDKVTTTLKDIDTSKLHYVKPPENHIVIDFDLKDETGNKSRELNLEAIKNWPPTYAEYSKGGEGVHLHYIYSGDVSKLQRLYSEDVEIKVFTGKSSLRRRLSQCNNMAVATMDSGLPLKEGKKVINTEAVKNEKQLRRMIIKNLNKEYHANTAQSVSFICALLNEAYESGISFDVSDMYNDVLAFAYNSTNQAVKCAKMVDEAKFKSEEPSQPDVSKSDKITFFDVEVFPNLLLICWKFQDEPRVYRMINPSPMQMVGFMQMKLVGFNNRKYDNHIVYAAYMGWSVKEIYKLSNRIITGSSRKNSAFIGEAYNVSYTDVYDFSSKKQSLKKFEIELGILHKELGLPWDKPVPKEKWELVGEYCDNDVIATEATFNARHADFVARLILADLAGMTANDTTNSLTTRIIFGKEKHPKLNCRWMGCDETPGCVYERFDDLGRPLYPGYEFSFKEKEVTQKDGRVVKKVMPVSTYRGEEIGEGGYVYSEPGMYGNVALLDIASMHPSSAVAEKYFGEYTQRFEDLLNVRIAIKHKDFDRARTMLEGKLAKYLTDENQAKALSQALKIAINSVYGLTSAKFDNPFRDIRNVDNIIAKRGALFMVNLKHRVQEMGFKVAHIKTDSIKIPDATPEIIKFVMEYGKKYGYTFEHEATYDRMCLVNDAVYIAKYKGSGEWTATGTQFAVPYVFKTLFSKEPIEFKDMCETKSVSKGSLYLDMNEGLDNVEYYEELASVMDRDPNSYRFSKKELRMLDEAKGIGRDKLNLMIDKGHMLQFVGRVGLFCPVKDGLGGGILCRVDDAGKRFAATGTSGYRWKEASDDITSAMIDTRYYESLVEDAKNSISTYGDFEWFVSDDPYIPVTQVSNIDIDLYCDKLPF